MNQLSLGGPEPSPHRVRGLAGILAGFAFPGRGSFEALRKPEQHALEDVARATLIDLAAAAERLERGT